jgi:hypothetical protein
MYFTHMSLREAGWRKAGEEREEEREVGRRGLGTRDMKEGIKGFKGVKKGGKRRQRGKEVKRG